MKTGNSLQNKAAFFAQYWGQDILIDFTNGGTKKPYSIVISEIMLGIERTYLEVFDISKITDQHLIETSKILAFHEGDGLIIDRTRLKGQIEMFDKYNDDPHYRDTLYLFTNDFDVHLIDENGNVFQYDVGRIIEVSDFIRSKGYALPWRDLSVQDLIDYGWIKLKDDENKAD